MKTFAHINQAGDIVGIGMIYLEDGTLTPEVAEFVAAHGEDDGILIYGDKVRPLIVAGDEPVPDPEITAIIIDTDEMPGGAGLTFDRTFRDAFKHAGGKKVIEDIVKAKELTHERRRAKRAAEFAPLDVEATIPAKAQEAESKRQAIRDRYAAVQAQIDTCLSPEELKSIIETDLS